MSRKRLSATARRQPIRASVCVVVCILGLGCAAPRATPRLGSSEPAPLEIRLVSSGSDCFKRPTAQRDALARETKAIAAALSAQGLTVAQPLLVEPTSRQLLAAVGAEARGPILWMYSGHGDLVRPGTLTVLTKEEKDDPVRLADSALCLADGPLPVKKVVGVLPRSAPFALMIVNACFSADVDIRSARTDMSLISLSTWETKVDGERTPLGEAMRSSFLASLDRDCDGSISDLELFAHLRDSFVTPAYGTPILKLRRQSRQPPKLLVASGCHPKTISEAHASEIHIEPYRHHGLWRVLVTGYLPANSPILVHEQTVEADRLQATSCRADIGQCFQPLIPLSGGR